MPSKQKKPITDVQEIQLGRINKKMTGYIWISTDINHNRSPVGKHTLQTSTPRSPRTRTSGKHWKNAVCFLRQTPLKINLHHLWILTLASLSPSIRSQSVDSGLPFGKLVRIYVGVLSLLFCKTKPDLLPWGAYSFCLDSSRTYKTLLTCIKGHNCKVKKVTQVNKNYKH